MSVCTSCCLGHSPVAARLQLALYGTHTCRSLGPALQVSWACQLRDCDTWLICSDSFAVVMYICCHAVSKFDGFHSIHHDRSAVICWRAMCHGHAYVACMPNDQSCVVTLTPYGRHCRYVTGLNSSRRLCCDVAQSTAITLHMPVCAMGLEHVVSLLSHVRLIDTYAVLLQIPCRKGHLHFARSISAT